MKTYVIHVVVLIVVSALALSGCVAAPTPEAPSATTPGATSPSEPAGEWQTYTDAGVGFTIQYPSTWSQQTLPDQNDGAIHGMAFSGPEGSVEVYWGVGFGGACRTETVPVQVSGVERPACYTTNADGTEVWSQVGYEVSGGNSFSVRASTKDAQPSSHDLVLQVLGTLAFMLPAEAEPGTAIATLQPPIAEVCNGMAQAMMAALNTEVTQSEVEMTDPTTGASGTGCRALSTGTGEQFTSPVATMEALTEVLEGGGWEENTSLAAGGPTGIGAGFRSGDVLCLAAVIWHPDESANCPQDQPVSACAVTPEQQLYTVTLDCAVETKPAEATSETDMANPASQNCIEQGGKLEIEERGDGGQFGVCYFEDNLQCEEWAMLRGDCPVGGIKVTGYVTPAARYCAITGGEYAITANSGAENEQGTCVLPKNGQCDASAYYNGTCDQTGATTDPLPSWNAGAAKTTILEFVADVTNPDSPSYVLPADRIAVFDNDGTLWTEKPIPAQAAFVFQRIVDLAPEHPEWATTQPYQAVLEQDVETLQSLSAEDVEKLVFATHAGMTEAEFDDAAAAFLATAKHPRFGVPYTATVYQPLLELLAYLRAHEFRTFIVSGGGVEFMRVFSEDVYGIPRENIIGSSLQYTFQLTPEGSVLVRQPEIVSFDNRAIKPVNIQLHIGRRPIVAVGNSNGDLEMFQYTGDDEGPFLNLAIVHDDAVREYDYLTGTDELMSAVAQSPWVFVSMKQDFKTVFP